MTPPPDAAAQRARMVSAQLRPRGITDPDVLRVMGQIPREVFVPETEVAAAYDDRALPIACGQTISQPYMVAIMTELLRLSGNEHVLEVGTGTGYQTAVLAALAKRVVSLERHAALSRAAERRLSSLGCANVQLHVGDGALGWAAGAPYDRVLVAAAAESLPPALKEQLADGGILVAPIGPASSQVLRCVRRCGDRFDEQDHVACRFVPLVSEDRPGGPA